MNYFSTKKNLSHLLTQILFIGFLGFLAGCSSADDAKPVADTPPVAYFSYNQNTSLLAPVTIDFINGSTNADSYLWTYDGTGRTLTSKDISLAFNLVGTYVIMLKAIGKGGTNEYSRTIVITGLSTGQTKPTADFSFSPSQNLVAPATVTFTNNSSNASSYKWDFGDGSTSTSTNPAKTFSNDGTYNVKLTATGGGVSTDVTKTIVVSKAASATGQAVFWTDKSTDWSSIDVTVGGTAAGSTTAYFTTAPACGANKAVTVTRAPGTYAFTAKSDKGITWSGNVTITANGCNSQKLNFPATTAATCDWSTHSNLTSLAIETKWGTCGADGLSVKVTNKTNVKLILYVAIEGKNGKWSLEGDYPAPGATHSFWDCADTGKYKYWAMAKDVYEKNSCRVPTP